MAGDPFRDAFRTELAAVVAAASPAIPWTVKDTLNTAEQPAPPVAGGGSSSAGYFEIEFTGGSEAQYTFGAPAANLHRERGQVTVRAVTRLRAGTTVRDLAETYLAQIRTAFRMRRFAAGARTIRITAVAPMGGGFDEGGMWVESLALAYETYNVG
jgi:hypothetical protein